MSPRLLICIPCHNRRRIAELCVPTVTEGMRGGDVLNLYNDGSTEYGQDFLFGLGANNVAVMEPSIGIERQRRIHFGDFDPSRFTHLYLTDSDALHDPQWRECALNLQSDWGGYPVCLYDTTAHSRLAGNTIKDDPFDEVIFRRVAPGISYLLTADHVATVMKAIKEMPDPLHWDWTVPAILGNKMAISRVSYVDHLGVGGLHHPWGVGYDGGDRATNPTAFLVQKRAEVVAKLNAT